MLKFTAKKTCLVVLAMITANCAKGPAEKLAGATSEATIAYSAELGSLNRSLKRASDQRINAIAKLGRVAAANRTKFNYDFALETEYGAGGARKADAFNAIRRTSAEIASAQAESRNAEEALKRSIKADLKDGATDGAQIAELGASLQSLATAPLTSEQFKVILAAVTSAAKELRSVTKDGEANASAAGQSAKAESNKKAAASS